MKEINYLFVTHGSFGKGIVSSLDVIMGNMLADYKVEYIEISNEISNDEVITNIYDYLKVKENNLVFILTDVAIGSSTQNCIRAMEKFENQPDNVHLITGINLPFVLSIFMLEQNDNQSIDKQINEFIEQNKEMLIYINSKERDEDLD